MGLNPSKLTQALEQFTDARDQGQLRALDAAIEEVDPTACGETELRAMLSVLERFPEDDGYGVFWSILHAVEACDSYELELLASVGRKPCPLTVAMINRLLNAGVTEVAGQDLEGALRLVERSAHATQEARRLARHFLAGRGHET